MENIKRCEKCGRIIDGFVPMRFRKPLLCKLCREETIVDYYGSNK